MERLGERKRGGKGGGGGGECVCVREERMRETERHDDR